jgi:hypothetical protein
MQTVYYNEEGQSVHEDKTAYARKDLDSKGGEKYYVKYNTSGVDAPHLANPDSVFARGNLLTQYISSHGKPLLDYKKVSKEVFDLYVRFLQTKNRAYYRNAERLLD